MQAMLSDRQGRTLIVERVLAGGKMMDATR